jgi:ribosomal subunit interface protein
MENSMEKKMTFRNMDHSNVMEQYVNEQLAKVEEFLTNEREPIFMEIVLEPSTVHAHHLVEIRLKTPDYNLISNYEGPHMYEVIDRVIDVLYQQVHEEKRKRVDAKRTADWYKGA